ncbi:hypothetical protein [Cellulophaga baltica]|uniref:hypothetical protein n=1 Tax=Cellulophaga baltica TaxID=76594 RepID=UPI002495377B|nr:hypothetical protein [Cellulophaga baltica]
MKLSITKFGLLLIASLSIYSCGQEKWSEEDKKEFIIGCLNANQSRFSEAIAEDMCTCMLNKMIEKHPNIAESKKMKPEEIKEIAVSCWQTDDKSNDNLVVHKTKKGKVEFLLDNWTDEKQDLFDLQCTDGDANMSVFVHNSKDLKTGTTKKEVLNMYIKDIMSRRENVKMEVDVYTKKYDEQTMYQAIYTADLKTNKNLYSFNVIDFGEDTDTFVFVLFSAIPSYGFQNMQNWNDILKTAKVTK